MRSQGHPPRLCGEVRSSGFSLLRAQGSLEAEIQTWDKSVRGLLFFGCGFEGVQLRVGVKQRGRGDCEIRGIRGGFFGHEFHELTRIKFSTASAEFTAA